MRCVVTALTGFVGSERSLGFNVSLPLDDAAWNTWPARRARQVYAYQTAVQPIESHRWMLRAMNLHTVKQPQETML